MLEMVPHGSKSSSSLNEKEENRENRNWIDLPTEVLESIMKLLEPADYRALRAVCSSWRSDVTNAIVNKHCGPLVIFISEELGLDSFGIASQFHSTRMGWSYHGSVEGWMIVSDHYEANISLSFLFFNPVTNRRIPVPPRLYFPPNSQEFFFVGNMVASSAPDCIESDCFLAAWFNNYSHIAFYRLFDKSWNLIEIEKGSKDKFMDMEIMGSKLYVRCLKSILVYDLKDVYLKPKVLCTLPQNDTPRLRRLIDNQWHVSGYNHSYLAKHETLEQLFFILVTCNIVFKPEDMNHSKMAEKFVTSPEITGVEVFKLDMTKEPIAWIKCESLDDNVAFVSDYKTMVMTRAGRYRKNCVHFALSFICHTNPWQGIRLGVKDFTDSSIEYLPVNISNHSKVPQPVWFLPSF